MTLFVIAAREFKTLFLSPLAWTVLAILQLLFAYLFLTQVETFTLLQPKLAVIENGPGLTDIIVPPLFGNAGIILLLVTPLLTMPLICAERRNKTLTLLLSAPVSSAGIIIGKYLGLLGLLLLIVALIAIMPLSLLVGGELDTGKFLANILALSLLVAAFAAAGLYLSTVASHPVIAAMGSFGLLLLLWILDWTTGIRDQRSLLFEYLSILRHFQNLQSGLIGSVDVGYFVLFIGGFLWLSIRSLDSNLQPRALSFPLARNLKQGLTTLLLLCSIGALAWLSARYPLQTDVTGNTGNTLSVATQKLLFSLPDKVNITAYIKKGQPIRLQIAQLVDRYRRHKSDVMLQFVDPDDQPEKTRELELGAEGAVIVDYQGRTEKLKFVDESILSNALLHLAHADQRWVSFLSGHGERSPDGVANFDLGQFGKELANRNIKALTLNLAALPNIPDNSTLLVIAAPAVPLLPGEQAIISRYIRDGGNLLLLAEPDNPHLDNVLQPLGIHIAPGGAIIDGSARLYGIDNPGFVVAGSYPAHAVTRDLQIITLYPVAAALEYQQIGDFHAETLLSTETGSLSSDASNNPHNPLIFGLTLSRNTGKTGQQRIAVIGDSDFLSNTYLGNAGNLDMGLRIINWLIHDDRVIDIPAKIAADKYLQLTQTAVAVIGFGFLIVIPAILIGTGFIVWRMRKRR